MKESETLYDFSLRRLGGAEESLALYRGKVVLVVNVASRCGFTKQYAGLQKLYTERQGEGLVILGFPSNDFGGQEPGTEEEIASFCSKNYGVSFPMFEKVVTQGDKASPLYVFLARGWGEPKWNFHKYLVGKDGRVRAAFPSKVAPDSAELAGAIAAALKE
ncbi:MAG: glutathione peroxidase [Blastochloris sp.]|nr:glutathione peroxidase [Blastochloris sp.]